MANLNLVLNSIHIYQLLLLLFICEAAQSCVIFLATIPIKQAVQLVRDQDRQKAQQASDLSQLLICGSVCVYAKGPLPEYLIQSKAVAFVVFRPHTFSPSLHCCQCRGREKLWLVRSLRLVFSELSTFCSLWLGILATAPSFPSSSLMG